VSLAAKGRIERIAAFPARDSIGSFYAAITHHLGFRHHRHEGKVTGLAAYADPRVAEADMRRMISYDPRTRRIHTELGRNQFSSIARIGRFFSRAYSREEIAAAAQAHLEHLVLEIVRQFLADTKRRKVLLAGGIFGNVKLNQRINQLDEVDYLFVHPGMGDEGLPVGAALACSAEQGVFRLARIENVYWGPGFDDLEAERAITAAGFPYERVADMPRRIASELAAHKMVARCAGRMEYGPRALGHRSLLFHAGDPSANDWLNAKLKRSEFMPFAPATLASRAAEHYRDLDSAAYAAEFMTVCFDCEPAFRARCPAVVHVDGTARPQLVTPRGNPDFHAILSEYERLTGVASVINTSFNIHEEPIVCSPQDALRAYADAELDYLALGSFLVSRGTARA
jgi:carbamoyltransferase